MAIVVDIETGPEYEMVYTITIETPIRLRGNVRLDVWVDYWWRSEYPPPGAVTVSVEISGIQQSDIAPLSASNCSGNLYFEFDIENIPEDISILTDNYFSDDFDVHSIRLPDIYIPRKTGCSLVYKNNEWTPCKTYIYKNGKWVESIPYVYNEGWIECT